MKLGFILKTTNSGDGEAFSINKEESWAKYATEVRSYIKELHNFDGTSKTVILVRFHGSDGYMISIIKARPDGSGRENDNTAAWIHFPAKIKISAKEVCSIIQLVVEELSARKSINRLRLEEAFNKQYDSKNTLFTAVEFITSNKDGNIGYRYFGERCDYQLYEYLGDSIGQIGYKGYKGIFFIDHSSGITIDKQEIRTPIKKICALNIPNVNNGFKVYIGNKPFSSPIEIPEDAKVSVVLKKNGYADIKKEISVSNPNISIEPKEYRRCIQKAWFHAYDSENKESLTSKISIKVDGQYFNDGVLYVAEKLDNHHNVEIQCNGYEPYKANIEINDNIPAIALNAKEYEETFILPKQDGNGLDANATIIIKTKKNFQSMPLKGYTVEGDKFLCYNNNIVLKIKWFFIGFISLFVIGALYQGYVAIDEFFDNHEFQLGLPFIVEKHIKTTTDDVIITDKAEAEQPEATNLDDKAIEYLNKQEAWIKDSLENYKITQGLFDAMNAFELESLTSEKYSMLMQSERFSRIFYAAQECLEQNIDVKKGTSKGHYNNKSTDNKITVDDYIQWLQNAPHEIKTEKNPTKTPQKSQKIDRSIKSSQGSASTETAPTKKTRGGL